HRLLVPAEPAVRCGHRSHRGDHGSRAAGHQAAAQREREAAADRGRPQAVRGVRLVSLSDVQAAAASVAGLAVRTPLLRCGSDELWVKPENLQPVGAFKVRGAAHALASLPPSVRARGVVTHSSGNHGQAVAYAARAWGVPAVVVMPDVALPAKIEATKALGAEVVLVPPAS